MKTVNFILGIHNHQPVGNFDHVFEEAYQASYLPMVNALDDFPGVRLMYHTTGPLFDWLENHHPEYFDILDRLVQRGQLELMTGGYYEPILAIIPDCDKLGQIEMMSGYMERRWKVRPRGMWMAERVWEPHLAKALNEAGVEFIALDDYHFFSAGLNPDNLLGYYRSDEQGHPISIFPISKKLRYLIPFGEPEAALNYLREQADDAGNNLLVMADDGEKFGLWPGTFEWVHKKGWLRRFFAALEDAMGQGWLKLTTCSQFMAAHPAMGRVFLPCASYFEMSAWSLPPAAGAKLDQLQHRYQDEGQLDEVQPFLKGGFWRNFLAKYDESNQMYRKMLWISQQLQEKGQESAFPPAQLEAARRALYRGQCNCAYWHGVFGGLYLPHLRHAVYQNFLEAEASLNWPREPFTWAKQADFDGDGSPDIYLRNDRLGIIASLLDGGSLYEFDYLPARFNLLNTLRRQPEAYHAQVNQAGSEIKAGESIHNQSRSKEQGLDQYLIYDRNRRGALIDHFLSEQESPQSLMSGSYYELGDFAGKPYERSPGTSLTGNSFELMRTAAAVDNQIELRKMVTLPAREDALQITYNIHNLSQIPLTILFAPEFNFALLSGNFVERYYYRADRGLDRAPLNSIGRCEGARRFSLFNENDGFAIHFEFDAPTEIWRYPCETVSQSEGGFERIYQSSCVLPIYRLSVAAKGKFSTTFKVRLQMLR